MKSSEMARIEDRLNELLGQLFDVEAVIGVTAATFDQANAPADKPNFGRVLANMQRALLALATELEPDRFLAAVQTRATAPAPAGRACDRPN